MSSATMKEVKLNLMENPPESTFHDGQCLHLIPYLSECSSLILTLLVCILLSISKLMVVQLTTPNSWGNNLWVNSDLQTHLKLFLKYQHIMELQQLVTPNLIKDSTVLQQMYYFISIMILQQIDT